MTVKNSIWLVWAFTGLLVGVHGALGQANSRELPDDVPWPSMPGPESIFITHRPYSWSGRWIVAENIHLLSCDDESVYVQECDPQKTYATIEGIVKANPGAPAKITNTFDCAVTKRTQSFSKNKFKSMLYRHVRNETISAAAQLGPKDFERIQAAPVDPTPYQETQSELKIQISAKEKMLAYAEILNDMQKRSEIEKLAELRAKKRKNDIVVNEIRKSAEARKKLERIVDGWVDYGICGEGMKKATGTTAKIINVVKTPRSMELCGESGAIRSRLRDCLKFSSTRFPTIARAIRPDGALLEILKTPTDTDGFFDDPEAYALVGANFFGPWDNNKGSAFTRKEGKAFCESLNRKDQYGLPNPYFSETNYRHYFWTIKPIQVDKGRIFWRLDEKSGGFYVLFPDTSNGEASRGVVQCTGVFDTFRN